MKDIGDTLTAQELTDLRDLLGHPGWRLVETMVDREWGAVAFGHKVANTVGKMTPADAAVAAQQVMQATAALEAVQRVMRWPRDQVAKAAHLQTARVASMNRGGL